MIRDKRLREDIDSVYNAIIEAIPTGVTYDAIIMALAKAIQEFVVLSLLLILFRAAMIIFPGFGGG